MKKVCLFLLAAVLLICAASIALAAEAKPGQEVTVTLNLNNTNAAYVRVKADYDTSVFELVGYSANSGTAGSNGIVVYDTKVLPSGAVGNVTLKVKNNAAPGTYTVSGVLAECYDLNENNGKASVSGGTVTVAGNATPKPTAAPTPKPTEAPTSKPTNDPASAAQYTLSDVSYNGKAIVGKLLHTDGTGFAQKLRVKVTFYIVGNYYMSTYGIIEEDGSFEVGGVGPIQYITIVAFDSKADGGTDRFDATELFVTG